MGCCGQRYDLLELLIFCGVTYFARIYVGFTAGLPPDKSGSGGDLNKLAGMIATKMRY